MGKVPLVKCWALLYETIITSFEIWANLGLLESFEFINEYVDKNRWVGGPKMTT